MDAIRRFDQLSGFAAAIVGLPVDVEDKIEVNRRDIAIPLGHDVAVFRIETVGCR